jgi:hypothetical protein
MAVLGHSQPKTVACGLSMGCFKVESWLTLIVAPQFLTVPNDTQAFFKVMAGITGKTEVDQACITYGTSTGR